MPALRDIVVPSTLLRTDSVYRTFGARAQRIGCGFWLAVAGSDERDAVHAYAALSLVLRGSALFTDHRREATRIRPGMAYIRLPGRQHSLAYGADYAECWLDLGAELGSALEALGLVDAAQTVVVPGLDLSLVRRFDRALTALRAAEVGRLPSLAVELLALGSAVLDLARRSMRDRHAAALDEACRELALGTPSRARLERIARGHGLGWETFRKVFARRVGCSPGAYRVRCRLDRARELLLSSQRSIAEIADELGYRSVATFTAQFRCHVGSPPGRFRRVVPTAVDQRR